MATSRGQAKIVPPVDTPPAETGRPGAANPAALSAEQLARLLGVPVETIRRHVQDGAPTGHDGTLNLVHYAAWLNRRLVAAEPEAKTDGD